MYHKLTQQDVFTDTIVLANEFVQQQEVQNKETEITMYYESRYYDRSRLFLESTMKNYRQSEKLRERMRRYFFKGKKYSSTEV